MPAPKMQTTKKGTKSHAAGEKARGNTTTTSVSVQQNILDTLSGKISVPKAKTKSLEVETISFEEKSLNNVTNGLVAIKAIETKIAQDREIVKHICFKKWCEKFVQKGSKPDNFVIMSEAEGNSITFVLTNDCRPNDEKELTLESIGVPIKDLDEEGNPAWVKINEIILNYDVINKNKNAKKALVKLLTILEEEKISDSIEYKKGFSNNLFKNLLKLSENIEGEDEVEKLQKLMTVLNPKPQYRNAKTTLSQQDCITSFSFNEDE